MSLDTLPPEILAQVVAHLPLRPSSLRPLSSLWALAATSRHLHCALDPWVNSSLRLDSPRDARALLERAPPSTHSHVASLHLGSSFLLDTLLDALSNLIHLRCDSLECDPSALLDSLVSSGASSRLERLDLAFAPSSTRTTAQRSTPLDLEQAPSPALRPPVRGPSRSSSLSHAPPEPSLGTDRPSLPLPLLPRCSCTRAWTRTCLALCTELRVLKLRGLVPDKGDERTASACCCPGDGRLSSSIGITSALKDGTAQTSLQELVLDEVDIGDRMLDEVLAAARGSLETLRLRNCRALTSESLIDAVTRHGSRIRHFELAVAASTSPAFASPSSLTHIIDALLPSLPHLTTLTLSSPASLALISPNGLSSLLALHNPHLRALELRGPYAARDALPLLQPQPRPGACAALRVLALHRPASASASAPASAACAGARGGAVDEEEQDDAATVEALWRAALERDVRLEGRAFDRARGRLEWALEGVAVELARGETARAGEEGTRRRKRPSLV